MLRRRKRTQNDFSEELQAHVAFEMDRLREDGLSEEEAYAAARRKFGNIMGYQERFYESGRVLWFDHLKQDIRYGLRQWRKSPAFTSAAILTLALGIGATTAIFTLVHAVLLKSLPVAKPEQLVRVGDKIHCCIWGGYSQDGNFTLFSYELYRRFRDRTPGFEELAAFQADMTILAVRRAGSTNSASTHLGEFVSGNYFPMFGVKAFAGRALAPADDRIGAPPVAMMSYQAWQEKFGTETSVIGGSFNINNKAFTVVGVTPPGFFGDTLRSEAPDFWIPLSDEPLIHGQSSILSKSDLHWLDIIGRVPPGANIPGIEARLQVELRQWLLSHVNDMIPEDRAQMDRQTIHLSPGGAGVTILRETYESGLRLLMMASGFVLLLVCANTANLMLARGVSRRQQASLAMALGAGPPRLMRQALTESLLLALAGGAGGVAIAFIGARGILHLAFEYAHSTPISSNPSLPVLLFAFLVSVATSVAVGLVPAWMAARTDPSDALRGAGRSTHDAGLKPRRAFVVLQAALSLALISSAALLTQSFRNLERQNYGFATDGRAVARIDPVVAGYVPEQLDLMFRQLRDRLLRIPGVTNVAYAMYSPMSGDRWTEAVFIQGQAPPPPGGDWNGSSWDRVGPGYFETVGSAIVRGRPVTEEDTATSRHVAVVNETFARRFFKNEDPIGKHFGKGGTAFAGDYEIVGVAADARYWSWEITKPIGPMFFVPASQWTHYPEAVDMSTETRSHYLHNIALRTAAAVPSLEPQIRRALEEINPNLTVIKLRTFADQVEANFGQQKMIAGLTSLFGLLALTLAAIGIYGVTAYSVARRSGEIGIRMALGADRASVVRLVLRGAFLLVAIGVATGIPLTLALGHVLGSKLYGVGAQDPFIIAGSIAVLAACALVAAFVPAVRAASITPLDALRAE